MILSIYVVKYAVIFAGCIMLWYREKNVVNDSIIKIIANIMGIYKFYELIMC